jgi:hypothetical protein
MTTKTMPKTMKEFRQSYSRCSCKYPNETVDFLNTIAKRGDEEVRSLVRKMRRDKGPKLPKEPQHPTDGDEVVPAMADRGHDMNSDQGQ